MSQFAVALPRIPVPSRAEHVGKGLEGLPLIMSVTLDLKWRIPDKVVRSPVPDGEVNRHSQMKSAALSIDYGHGLCDVFCKRGGGFFKGLSLSSRSRVLSGGSVV